MDAVAAQGLRLGGILDETVRIETATELPPVEAGTLVIVAVKAHDTDAAGRAIQEKIHPGAEPVVLLSVQNGLGNHERLRRRVPGATRVLRGLATLGCTLAAPGRIDFWGGRLLLEPGAYDRRLQRLLERSGIETAIAEDFSRQEWIKWILNCVNNPLTAILRVRNDQVVTETLRPLRARIAAECADLARASGVDLPEDVLPLVDQSLAASRNRSSMLQDIEAGRATEIAAFNGEAVRRADELGMDVPVNQAMVSLIAALEALRLPRSGQGRTDADPTSAKHPPEDPSPRPTQDDTPHG